MAAPPRATIRPDLPPEERQWQDLAATMPDELALMIRFDPVLRTMAAGGAVNEKKKRRAASKRHGLAG